MVPSNLILSLATAANAAINGVLRTGATSAGQSPPTGEVGFVAAVVIGGVPALANAWTSILNPAGYSVQITGVFCHQSPMVDFTDAAGTPQRCELADLLVVVDDQTGATPGSRWAVLVQAKMAAAGGGQTLSRTQDLVQLELLSTWPKFTLPPTFLPSSRVFSTCRHAGRASDCGRYGLIDPQPAPVWRQQPPAVSMPAGGLELGSFLAHMVETGQTGYGREATGVADDWSFTVDELLRVTASSTFAYSRGFKTPQPRGVTALATFGSDPFGEPHFPSLWASAPPPSGSRPEGVKDEPPAEGISTLYIGISRYEASGRAR